MKDPLISRFAEACGATGPLDLGIELAQGGVLAEGSVSMPFALVGRDDACDVTLTDAAVNPRHAWLQVVDGRVFAVDLGSRSGLKWPRGVSGSAWLDLGVPVQVGPFQLRLKSIVSSGGRQFPPTYQPLQSDTSLYNTRPAVNLEFRNGNRAKDRWTVNRLLTLIGRSPDCKIRLSAEGIASFHCGLVLVPNGLWVVDLSGRGVVVNGERMRVAPLLQDAELWVGRFLIGINYPAAAVTPLVSRQSLLTFPNPIPALAASSGVVSDANTLTSRTTSDDEVELGAAPTIDPMSGLPSSHILADAFRSLGEGSPNAGPVSNPIVLSNAVSAPFAVSGFSPADTPSQSKPGSISDLFGKSSDPTAEVVELLRQLGDMHGQMLGQFQHTLMLMVQLFDCLQQDQLPAMQRQLERIQELNAQLTHLQGEVARRAAEMITARKQSESTATPAESDLVAALPGPSDSTDLHHWVVDRINSLQKERQMRWQSIVGMFSEQNAG